MSRFVPPALRRALPALAVLSLAAPVAGCGGGSAGDGDADPAAAVPARAPLYLQATVRPEGQQKADVEAAAKKVLGTDDPGAEIVKLLERSASRKDVSFAKDIDPWLGKHVGVFFSSLKGTSPDAAVVVASKDDEKAQSFIDDQKGSGRTYRDTKYKVDGDSAFGLVDGYVVSGSEAAVKQVVDATKGQSLAEADRYKQAKDVGDDPEAIGRLYVDPQGVLDAVARSGAQGSSQVGALRQLLAGSGAKPVLATFSADDRALRLKVAQKGGTAFGGPESSKALAALPAGAWLGVAIGDVGPGVQKLIDRFGQIGGLAGADPETLFRQLEQQTGLNVKRDLLAWMGQGALFVQGTSLADLGGALVVQSKDPAATRRALPKVRKLVGQFAGGSTTKPLNLSGVDEGFTVDAKGVPLPIHLAAAGDRFILAIGTPAMRAALKPQGTLGSAPDFKAATANLSDGINPLLYLGISPVLELAQGLGAGDQAGFDKVREALDAFTAVVAGSQRDGDITRFELVAGLK